MDRWVHTGALSGPRRPTIRQLRYGTWVHNTVIAPAPAPRQDKTRQACWAQQVLAGWVVPSFARCDLGRYLAGCRAASGIVRYLDCTLWVAAVPWPGALALEPDLGPGRRREWERDERQRAGRMPKKSSRAGSSRGSLPRPCSQVPQVPGPRSQVPSPTPVSSSHAHAHTHPPTPIMVLVPFPFAFPFAFSFALPFASANSLTHTHTRALALVLSEGARDRERALPVPVPSPSPVPSSHPPVSSHHPSSPGSSCPTRRRPLNNKTVLPRPRHRPLPSRAFLCFLSFSHLRPFHQPCPTLQAPFAFSSVDVGSTSEDLRSSRLLNPDSRLSGPRAIAGHLVLRETRGVHQTHICIYIYIYLCV